MKYWSEIAIQFNDKRSMKDFLTEYNGRLSLRYNDEFICRSSDIQNWCNEYSLFNGNCAIFDNDGEPVVYLGNACSFPVDDSKQARIAYDLLEEMISENLDEETVGSYDFRYIRVGDGSDDVEAYSTDEFDCVNPLQVTIGLSQSNNVFEDAFPADKYPQLYL